MCVKYLITFILIHGIYSTSLFHRDEDYMAVDDLPLQDLRLARTDGDNKTATPDNDQFGKHHKDEEDWTWMEEALRDVAYNLRSHKFNEYDRRYENDSSKAAKDYHLHFPRPALRNLHWEVHKFCETSFASCAGYLWKKVKLVGLKRADDTAVVLQEQKWKLPENRAQIEAVEAECRKIKAQDDALADPFQGPLERFQWRATASYYMCWYTMNEVPALRHLLERCDNYADCSPEQTGDFRANDEEPFGCALYSFCPDPCCQVKRSVSSEDCSSSPENPCYLVSPPEHRKCSLNRTNNIDLREIIMNHWNISCYCQKAGFEYNSKYGICVDIDECDTGTHTCKKDEGEACMNIPGSFKCVCKWGHAWGIKSGKCEENEAIALIKMNKLSNETGDGKIREKSYLRYWFKKMFASSSSSMSGDMAVVFISTLIFII